MNLQKIVDREVAKMRQESFSRSDQLTLGDLIALLGAVQYDPEDPPRVVFDFGTARPSGVSSWRGSYCELAIEYSMHGYDSGDHATELLLPAFKDMITGALGATFCGWKGGDFTMHENTPVWVANPGNSGSTGVVGVTATDYEVYIDTAHVEY